MVVALTGDHHCNSTLGLCPPEGVRLDDGGRYLPNAAQLWLWNLWEKEYWPRVQQVRKAEKACLVCGFNGDATDGDHHNTPQIVSRNLETQSYIFERAFGVPLGLKPDHIAVIRGTAAHVGPSGSTEEALARSWGKTHGHPVVKDETTDAWSHWHWRPRINGRLLDIQHHSSVGGKPWTETGYLANLAREYTLECHDAGEEIPDLVVRSHRHRFGDSGDAFSPRWIAMPAWQIKTEHAHKVAPNKIASIGGVIVVIKPDGEMRVETMVWRPPLPKVWEL